MPSRLLAILIGTTFSCITPFHLLAQETSNPIELTITVNDEWDQERFNELLEKAEELWDTGQVDEALNLYRILLSWTEDLNKNEYETRGALLWALGSLYAEKGLFELAEKYLKEELELTEKSKGSDHIDTATSLNSLAELYKNIGSFALSESLYIRAILIQEEELGPRHLDLAVTLNGLANVYRELSEYEKAEKLLLRSLDIEEDALGPNHPDLATTLNNLGGVYLDQSLLKRSESYFLRSLEIEKAEYGPDHPYLVTTLSNLGVLYSNNYSFDKAEKYYLKAIKIEEQAVGNDHPDMATLYNNIGTLYRDNGLYKKAEPLLVRSLALNENYWGANSHQIIASLNNLATLYQLQGFLSKAELIYLRILSISEDLHGVGHINTAFVLNNLGLLYQDQGMLEKAEFYLAFALTITEEEPSGNELSLSTSLGNLALNRAMQNLFKEAEELYLRALKIDREVLGPGHPELAITLNNLALLYHDRKILDKAEEFYLNALDAAGSKLKTGHPDIAQYHFNLGSLYADLRQIDNAERYHLDSLAGRISSFGYEHPQTVRSLMALAYLYQEQDLFAKSQPIWQRALALSTILIQREAALMPRQNRQNYVNYFEGDYKASFSNTHLGEDGLRLAFFARLNRQGLLEEIERRQAQLAILPGEQREVAERLRAVTQQLSSLSLSNEQREQLKDRKEQLERELYQLLPELKPRIVEVADIAAVLPSDGALVEFQRYQPFDGSKDPEERWSDARYLAMVLRSDESIEVVDLGLVAPVEEKIEQALVASESRDPDAALLWQQVGDLVMAPLGQALAGVRTLVVSPDGELNRMPFAALPAPEGEGLLADRYQLRLVTTGRELLDLQKPVERRGQTPLVVANPDFDLLLSSDAVAALPDASGSDEVSAFAEAGQLRSAETDQLVWAPLPGTKKEGEKVSTLIDGELLMNREARAAAIQEASVPSVLHIASHAFFLPDQEEEKEEREAQLSSIGLSGEQGLRASKLAGESPLLRSGIALAGANRVSENQVEGSDDDGYLTALEVAQLDWAGTELVVISACESGKGEIKAGEGVYGLKRAIAVSGARSSLLSLWKVDDTATASFMENFYRRLKAGEGRADALAATQKDFRSHPVPAWQHPSVWAAFQLSGDWGPISGLNAQN